ncbi:hypothetical protein SF1_42380 [Sphingobacterium faecium NBRC 15299]|uniref:helix-turn-helix domain-containing protein n=1 Tax=Sphingobacterium faecium TaxID=34087 RepID=UPI000D3A745C|nr:helix-turn-helix transcriptional regulator [Sphingobacterium faecium]PTX10186.1 helix-turn-helix protein [Sphingobacterium faecium]GEM66256.1 hypothetical protein SF1_42380 [Sphingobacterium faecium NBRC 15299]
MKKNLEKKGSESLLIDEYSKNIVLKFTAKKIAFKIQYELKRRELTQLDLATTLNVTPQNISKLLKGDDYKISTLVKIEQALKINLIDRDIFREKREHYIIIELKPLERKIRAYSTQYFEDFQNSSSRILYAEILSKESMLKHDNEFDYEI